MQSKGCCRLSAGLLLGNRSALGANPLYDWDYLEATDYEWWFERIKAASKLYDITRIDHFRAFASYYSIPYPAENAINGEWVEGPRIKFFNMMEEALGKIDIVAEDLGNTHSRCNRAYGADRLSGNEGS